MRAVRYLPQLMLTVTLVELSVARFQQLHVNSSNLELTSINIFLFGVHATSVPFAIGSNILLNCEYSTIPGAQVAHIAVGKYSGATNFLYEYMCGADSIGRPVSVYNQTSDYTSNSRDKLKLAYIGDGIPLSCENIPVQRGSIMFELKDVTEEDVGDFYCKVNLKGDSERAYKYSNRITNENCPLNAQNECISYDSADLKICPLDCEHSCHPLGSGWVCLCYAGYKLTGDLMTCEFDSNIQVYDEADLMGH
ncbi:hypothetical protein EB796_003630 [Bugula neritina]|uniref:Uncharacterized protein n=1 Tax=Bugula neritina TaxID=10212 RepID=A0A7J7KHC6_BUGNE|nr:hypothetical protein EB796_003630 [Bugula neritina]